jgi:hypothetical protein
MRILSRILKAILECDSMYVYTLKDAAGTTKQTQTSTHQTLHNGVDVIAFKIMPRYNNPANNWEVKTSWTVNDVT